MIRYSRDEVELGDVELSVLDVDLPREMHEKF